LSYGSAFLLSLAGLAAKSSATQQQNLAHRQAYPFVILSFSTKE